MIFRILCCPDENSQPKGQVAQLLQSVCENQMDRFAILQSGPQEGKPSGVVPTVYSEYAAYYYPWLNVVDPTTNITTLIPPGGHIAGIYARSDQNENVAKDPANEQIVGIDSLQLPIDNGTQGILNPHRRKLSSILQRTGKPGLGRAHHLARPGLEIYQRAEAFHLRGKVDPARHAVGGFRAERHAHVGARHPQRQRFSDRIVDAGYAAGRNQRAGLFRTLRSAPP